MDVKTDRASSAQKIYGRFLKRISTAALVLVLAAFALYASGLLPGRMSPSETAAVWHLPASELRARGCESGRWQWLRCLPAGDALSLASLAFLASGSMLCLLRILPALLAERRRLLALIVALEIAILALAASGITAAP